MAHVQYKGSDAIKEYLLAGKRDFSDGSSMLCLEFKI